MGPVSAELQRFLQVAAQIQAWRANQSWGSNHVPHLQAASAPLSGQPLGGPLNTVVTSGTSLPLGVDTLFLHQLQPPMVSRNGIPHMLPGLTAPGSSIALRAGPPVLNTNTTVANQSAVNTTAQEALQAVINGLETAGPKEDEYEPLTVSENDLWRSTICRFKAVLSFCATHPLVVHSSTTD